MDRTLGRTALLVVTMLLASACASPAPEPTPRRTPTPSPIPSASLDPRLAEPLAELAAHADWTGGAQPPFGVTKVQPSIVDLCVEMTAAGSPPLSVAIDVARTPWVVSAVGALPEGATEPVAFYERVRGEDAEMCRAVLAGPSADWPPRPDAIEVSGYAPDEAMIPALRQALFDDPTAFGIDRTGLPSLDVRPMESCDLSPCEPVGEPSPGLVCLSGGVSQGWGAIAAVALGLRREGDAWKVVSVRLTSKALADVSEAPPGGC